MKYKIIIGIVAVYLIVMGVLLYFYNKNNIRIILSPFISIEYKSGKWQSSNLDTSRNYNIYTGTKFVTKSKVKKGYRGIYVEDMDLTDFIGITTDSITPVEYDVSIPSPDDYKAILDHNNISDYGNLFVNEEIEIDYDNDNVLEKVIFLSNDFSNEFEVVSDQKNIFSIVITIDDDIPNVVYLQQFSNSNNSCQVEPETFLQKDDKIIMFTRCTYYDKNGRKSKIQIYEVKDNKLAMVAEI